MSSHADDRRLSSIEESGCAYGALKPPVRGGSAASQVDGWQEERSSSAAVTESLSRGSKLERFGCTQEALLVYEKALTSPKDERSPFATYRLLHGIGVCALDFQDGPRAFASFIDAGHQARDFGMRRPCGESLAMAGWSLAAHLAPTPVVGVVDGDLVATGFGGVLEEAREVLLVDGQPSYYRASAVHSRFAGLMVLSAEASLDEASSLAAENLVDDVLTPFLALHDVLGRTTADPSVVTAYRTQALARLCRALGEQGRQRRMGAPVTREAVTDMARHVANAFVWKRREQMRWWVGSYLRRHRGTDWTNDDHLLAAGHD